MLDTLNPEQREAVVYIDGPCLVLAGAGSGKTRVITAKLVHLVETCGFDPKTLLAVTFTNKAAAEMRERVGKMMHRKTASQMTLSTFHSFGVHFLRELAQQGHPQVGLRGTFSILDSDDTDGLLKQASGLDDKAALKALRSKISLWKNAFVDPAHAAAQAENDMDHGDAKAYGAYQELLSAYNAVDFDDLIMRPVELMDADPAIASLWQNRLRYILVDEYQDTSTAQYRLLKHLVGVRGAFTAVGDDDQAIYAWRGASSENIHQLRTDYPRLHVIKLERNYRSTAAILDAANTLIANNPKMFDKRLKAEAGQGEPIIWSACDEDEDEAEKTVRALMLHRAHNRKRWADYAILYRSNLQSRIFEQFLRKEGVPYKVSGGQSFFDRAEVKDLLAYLRLIANDDDDPAFLRAIAVPRRGVGPATLRTLSEYAAMRQCSLFAAAFETGLETRLPERSIEPLREFGELINRLRWRGRNEPAVELIQDLLRAIRLDDHYVEAHDERTAKNKSKNLSDFTRWLLQRAETEQKPLMELAQQIALISQLSDREGEQDVVTLSTLHAAKGLEWPHVFLVGVEEGLLPHKHPDEEEESPARIEEERRLAYVGITRARETLTVSWCVARKRSKGLDPRDPSRFIAEIGTHQAEEAKKAATPTAHESRGTARALLAQLRQKSQQHKDVLKAGAAGKD